VIFQPGEKIIYHGPERSYPAEVVEDDGSYVHLVYVDPQGRVKRVGSAPIHDVSKLPADGSPATARKTWLQWLTSLPRKP
jgi:hypothetical protein